MHSRPNILSQYLFLTEKSWDSRWWSFCSSLYCAHLWRGRSRRSSWRCPLSQGRFWPPSLYGYTEGRSTNASDTRRHTHTHILVHWCTVGGQLSFTIVWLYHLRIPPYFQSYLVWKRIPSLSFTMASKSDSFIWYSSLCYIHKENEETVLHQSLAEQQEKTTTIQAYNLSVWHFFPWDHLETSYTSLLLKSFKSTVFVVLWLLNFLFYICFGCLCSWEALWVAFVSKYKYIAWTCPAWLEKLWQRKTLRCQLGL